MARTQPDRKFSECFGHQKHPSVSVLVIGTGCRTLASFPVDSDATRRSLYVL